MSEKVEKVEVIPAVVPVWATDLLVRVAKLEVKMNIIAGLATIGTSAALIDLVGRMIH